MEQHGIYFGSSDPPKCVQGEVFLKCTKQRRFMYFVLSTSGILQRTLEDSNPDSLCDSDDSPFLL